MAETTASFVGGPIVLDLMDSPIIHDNKIEECKDWLKEKVGPMTAEELEGNYAVFYGTGWKLKVCIYLFKEKNPEVTLTLDDGPTASLFTLLWM